MLGVLNSADCRGPLIPIFDFPFTFRHVRRRGLTCGRDANLVIGDRIGGIGPHLGPDHRCCNGNDEENADAKQDSDPGGDRRASAPQHADPKRGGENDCQHPSQLKLLEDVHHHQRDDDRSGHDHGAGPTTHSQARFFVSRGVDIGNVDISHDQCRTDDHVGIHRTHQRRQQAGEHQPGESWSEQFTGSHAPRLVWIRDQAWVIGK